MATRALKEENKINVVYLKQCLINLSKTLNALVFFGMQACTGLMRNEFDLFFLLK